MNSKHRPSLPTDGAPAGRSHPTRVLIVERSSYRRIAGNALEADARFELAGSVESGAEALRLALRTAPDRLVLGTQLADMSPEKLLADLAARGHTPTVVWLTTNGEAAPSAGAGATAVAKPDVGAVGAESGTGDFTARLLKALAECNRRPSSPAQAPGPPPSRVRVGSFDVVVVAISTGGPEALRTFLPSFPSNFALPMLIVQHIQGTFTDRLLGTLSERCQLTVRSAEEGAAPRAGEAVFAPGGAHMIVQGRRTSAQVAFEEGPPLNNCKPAADRLFETAAEVWGARTLGIVMTGMGVDGLAGARAVRAAGGTVICQAPETCTVAGMPGAVIEAGLADEVIGLGELADHIQYLSGAKGRRWAG